MSINPEAKSNRNWPRLSLATLLLLVTVAALGVSHFLTSRDLEEAQAELTEYRYQYGHLKVKDPKRIHLLSHVNQSNPWKWHAYFPQDQKFKLVAGIGVFGPNETPEIESLKPIGEMMVVGTGENTTLSFSIDDSDLAMIKLTMTHDGASTTQGFPKSDLPWLTTKQSTTKSSGYKEPFVGNTKKASSIFWFRKSKTKGATVMLDANPTEGIIVLAVPVQ